MFCLCPCTFRGTWAPLITKSLHLKFARSIRSCRGSLLNLSTSFDPGIQPSALQRTSVLTCTACEFPFALPLHNNLSGSDTDSFAITFLSSLLSSETPLMQLLKISLSFMSSLLIKSYCLSRVTGLLRFHRQFFCLAEDYLYTDCINLVRAERLHGCLSH